MVKSCLIDLITVKLFIEVINPRILKVTPINEEFEVLEDGKLVGLDYGDYKIFVGSCVNVHGQKYKIQEIRKAKEPLEYGIGYYLYTHKLSKTTSFVMPILGATRDLFKYRSDLCNAFIGDGTTGEYGDQLYLLYRFNASKEFADFEEKLQQHPLFAEIRHPDKYHVMFVFNIPDRYKEDIKKILDGKYSSVSPEYKNRILHFNHTDVNSPLGQILTKSDVRKKKMEKDLAVEIPEELDLLDLFKPEEEIYLTKYLIDDE